jgi:hypothetical protein
MFGRGLLPLVCLLLAAASAHAGPCDLLGGDADGDGICDDGDGSGVAGDAPCSCQPGSPASCLSQCDDNCPFAANPGQLDVGGVGPAGLPDHVGDACQCLDVSGDGLVSVLDATLYRRKVAGLGPVLPAPQKCLGAGANTCESADVGVLRSALAGGAAPANTCEAAGACTASADCPVGIACNLGAQRCQDNVGQACAQNGQCLTGACCAQRCADPSTDLNNCGACGISCTNPHGTQACSGGSCAPTCAFPWGSCDANPRNGCETALDTLANCGGCGTPCALANATATCPNETCTLASCNAGWANCDGNSANGCERNLTSCSGGGGCGVLLGSFQGDANGCFLSATRSATGSASYTVTFREDSGINCAPTSGLVQLTVPGGIDYDLNVSVPGGVTCQHWNGSAYVAGCNGTNGTGATEIVRLVNSESCTLGFGDGVDQTFSATIQVQFFSGSSCSAWQLQVSAGGGC